MDKEILKDKIMAMFLGVAIGDALGAPVETFSAEQIMEKFGFITDYIEPKGHKWFDGRPAGSWTDDTQLTLAIARSLNECGKIDIENIAKKHIEEYQRNTKGWGKGTKNSIARIIQGISPFESGDEKAVGNGVAMKVAPLGAYYASQLDNFTISMQDSFKKKVAQLGAMTHRNKMGVASGLVHMEAIVTAITNEYKFQELFFFETIMTARIVEMEENELTSSDDKLSERIIQIGKDKLYATKSVIELSKMFGDGSCYVYNSLPFSYAVFLKYPDSINGIYEAVNAGGDTDTNASIVGSLLGARNGMEIFPKHLIDGLQRKEEIISVAEKFCDRFVG